MASEVLAILSKTTRFQELENELVGLLGYLRFDFIKLLLLNRKKIGTFFFPFSYSIFLWTIDDR